MHQGPDLNYMVNVNNVKAQVTLHGKPNQIKGVRQANEIIKISGKVTKKYKTIQSLWKLS